MPPKDKDPKEEEQVEETEQESTEETETQEETEEEEISVEELRSRLKEKEKRLREVSAEAKQRRLALEALEKEKKEREEAELTEAEKLKKTVSDRETELETLRKENRSLKLSTSLEGTIRELRLEFASEKAREDALRLLAGEDLGEDFENLEDSVKAMLKDRSYLFKKTDPNQFIDDGRKKSKTSPSTVTRSAIDKMRERVGSL